MKSVMIPVPDLSRGSRLLPGYPPSRALRAVACAGSFVPSCPPAYSSPTSFGSPEVPVRHWNQGECFLLNRQHLKVPLRIRSLSHTFNQLLSFRTLVQLLPETVCGLLTLQFDLGGL